MPTIEHFSPIINDNILFPGVSLELIPGEIISIVGRSGCGKTSLFNAIRQQIPHTGKINFNTEDVFSVFQENLQLFPWFTIKKNLELVCYHNNWSTLVDKWNLTELLSKYPTQLSVGQIQRFTLIRALCSSKNILLCDEPLSGVDDITKRYILSDFKTLLKDVQKYCLWITHDLTEAKILSNNILMLSPTHIQLASSNLSDNEILSVI